MEQFETMLREHWAYVPGAAREGEVDCSGAFTYCYSKAGSSCPHGSNSMFRLQSTKKGRIGDIELKPGMPVYRHKDDGQEPDKFKKDNLGNFNHVGCYVGGTRVIEAKGEKYGVVESDISTWEYASELKYTNYDVGTEADTDTDEIFTPVTATVAVQPNSTLNLRKKPSTAKDSTILARIPYGTELTLTDAKPGWYKTSYKNTRGWVSADYIQIADAPQHNDFMRVVTLHIDNQSDYEYLMDFVRSYA